MIGRENHERVVIDSEFLELPENYPKRIVDPRFTHDMAVRIETFFRNRFKKLFTRCHDLGKTLNFPLSRNERMVHRFSP